MMPLAEEPGYVVGVDVRTGSARAAVFNLHGARLSLATCPIQMWKPYGEFAEQSSDDIWQAVGMAVRQAVADAAMAPALIQGIGFGATCSLVVLDRQDRPLSVSPEGDPSRNVIVWMDHRAVAEAEQISQQGGEPLKYVGGTISPEMEIPKLLWMQQHADILGLTLTRTREPEAVLLGAAILGTVACGAHSDIPAAMQAMTHIGETLLPDTGTQAYHDAKYECDCSLY